MQYDYYIKEINETKNGKQYEVVVELPKDIGWVNYTNLIIEKGNEKNNFPLIYLKSEDNKIYFYKKRRGNPHRHISVEVIYVPCR